MCTLFIYRSKNTDWPIFIANNRDEFLSRKFYSPGYYWQDNAIFAGKDLLEGGTWMGINKNGLCAVILNRNSISLKKKESRGHIIIEVLRHTDAYSALRDLKRTFKRNTKFFNLLILDYKNSYWIKYNEDGLIDSKVPYGYSIIDNFDLNDKRSLKQKLSKRLFLEKKLPDPQTNNFQDWQNMLFLENKNQNDKNSSIYVKDINNNYGTVCSSIIGLPNKSKIKKNIIWLYSENKNKYKNLLPFSQ